MQKKKSQNLLNVTIENAKKEKPKSIEPVTIKNNKEVLKSIEPDNQ